MRRPSLLAILLTLALTAVVTLTGAGAAAAAPPPSSSASSPSPSDPLGQTLDPNQGTGTGHVVLDQGHVDIGPRLHDDRWSIAIHDDTKSPSLWRSPSDVVLKVGDESELPAPTNSDYGFLGAAQGHDVYVIPQTQNRDVVWAGWNTQDPNVMSALSLGATFTFHGVTGPGDLFVFLQSGVLGPPQVLWTSAKKQTQTLFVQTNTHTHANWVFTKPGVYLVDFQISGTLTSGKKVSDRQSLRFAVGDATNPQQAFTAKPTTAPSVTGGAAGSASPGASSTVAAGSSPGASSGGGGTVWIVLAIVVVLLAAGVVTTSLRTRRHKAAAAEDR